MIPFRFRFNSLLLFKIRSNCFLILRQSGELRNNFSFKLRAQTLNSWNFKEAPQFKRMCLEQFLSLIKLTITIDHSLYEIVQHV